jgi:hypothetical protein
MLLGNKCDLPEREVPYNAAMEYARSKNFGFLEVSAKTGMNIKSSFNCLVRGKNFDRRKNNKFVYRNLQKLEFRRRSEEISPKKHIVEVGEVIIDD